MGAPDTASLAIPNRYGRVPPTKTASRMFPRFMTASVYGNTSNRLDSTARTEVRYHTLSGGGCNSLSAPKGALLREFRGPMISHAATDARRGAEDATGPRPSVAHRARGGVLVGRAGGIGCVRVAPAGPAQPLRARTAP